MRLICSIWPCDATMIIPMINRNIHAKHHKSCLILLWFTARTNSGCYGTVDLHDRICENALFNLLWVSKIPKNIPTIRMVQTSKLNLKFKGGIVYYLPPSADPIGSKSICH